MKAIVGLGNPGPKYQRTRHNIGFAVADELARRRAISFESAPVEALVARWRRRGGSQSASYTGGVDLVRDENVPNEDVLIAKPLTFMNNSGAAVGALLRYFRVEVGDVLIVIDEVQLPLGRLRVRTRGSAGGHNGLKSVIAHVGETVARLRIGVGRGDSRRDMADHVLARFDSNEAAEVERMTMRAADAAEMFMAEGIAAVMNAFNGGDSTADDVRTDG